MKSYGMALALRDDPAGIARYKAEHRRAWPEVIACLRGIGITGMKIYLLERKLFMYCEAVDGFDPARDFPRLLENARYREWDTLMSSLQERLPEAQPGEWWAGMQEVFDLNWPVAPGGDAHAG